jgi:hypothetical protein
MPDPSHLRRSLVRLLESKADDAALADEGRHLPMIEACLADGDRLTNLLIEAGRLYEKKRRKLNMPKEPTSADADSFCKLTWVWADLRQEVIRIGR